MRIIEKNIHNGWLTAFILLISLGMASPTQDDPSRSYQIKAVFLYNFTQFVEWPPQSFESPEAPLVIGILGKDPFGSYLDETVLGEAINNHPLVIHRYKYLSEVDNCHILFLNVADKYGLKRAINKLKNRNILTVSDAANFADLGGVIEFFTKDNKTRMRINLGAAKAANLKISSKLLSLAEIVSQESN